MLCREGLKFWSSMEQMSSLWLASISKMSKYASCVSSWFLSMYPSYSSSWVKSICRASTVVEWSLLLDSSVMDTLLKVVLESLTSLSAVVVSGGWFVSSPGLVRVVLEKEGEGAP